jgi:NAD+ synthase (glutamine-hydrolysing)
MENRAVLRAAIGQINTTVGDLAGNRDLVLAAYHQAVAAGARLVVFPELTLTGYPPEDLLLKPSFTEDAQTVLNQLIPQVREAMIVVGFAEPTDEGPANSAAIIAGGQLIDIYRKTILPNYGVFDEKRYFVPGDKAPIYEIGPWRLAVNICEDLWVSDGVPDLQAGAGRANLMVNLSASPYHARKGAYREELIRYQARHLSCPILYANLTGGQDELVFDGQSLAVDHRGEILARGPQFASHLMLIDLPVPGENGSGRALDHDAVDELDLPASDISPELDCKPIADFDFTLLAKSSELPEGAITIGETHGIFGEEEEMYQALIQGLRDYVHKNGFAGVVIGLSGGIDSALTATIAADALGADAVVGVSMPTEYSSETSKQGARDLAANLGCIFHEIPITSLLETMLDQLRTPLLADDPPDVTEENIQARLRGTILMAFSNRMGNLVLATGNKSEIAVGYCTLYGDMVGGYSVLKDLLKTQVYRLSKWRNEQSPQQPVIPEDTITRPPSAELRPDQKDSDSLPEYDLLDPIITAIVEEERSPRELISEGFDAEMVNRVFALIQGNEYKRRQGAPGIKITPRAFGRDRRYPLTNRYRPRDF